ncbi:MAG: DEAD/DEAH box helicase [Ornithinimicrobium sp.]
METLPLPSQSFADLGVPSALVSYLGSQGISSPTPIQAATLPDSLAGRDVLGRGSTGSGKTYAFALPVIARLQMSSLARKPRRPRALILAPTRELASQIAAAIEPLARTANLRVLTVFGGVGKQPQIRGLNAGVDLLIACPGRLEDLLQGGQVNLDGIEITVLDEADHMADLGFLPSVKRLMDRTPKRGQRMLFSATLDRGIDVLVKRYLSNPVRHSADSPQSPVSTMEHHVLHIARADRIDILADLTFASGRSLVFSRTKHGAKKMAKQLNDRGVPSVELHGNLAQNARTRNLEAFHSGRAPTLVATDIAARGIHVDDVALVIHADPPAEHKAYLHRSGRTARAGASGRVVTLMTDEQVRDVKALTKAAGVTATTTRVRVGHPMLRELAPRPDGSPALEPVGSPSTTAPGAQPHSASPTLRSAGQRSGGRPSGNRRSGGQRNDRQRSDGRRTGGSRSGGQNQGRGRPAGSTRGRSRYAR